MLLLVFARIAALRYLVCAGGELDFPLIRLPAHYSKLGKLGFLKNFVVNLFDVFCQTPVLGLRIGVDFTFAWDNHNNHNNPHLNFV